MVIYVHHLYEPLATTTTTSQNETAESKPQAARRFQNDYQYERYPEQRELVPLEQLLQNNLRRLRLRSAKPETRQDVVASSEANPSLISSILPMFSCSADMSEQEQQQQQCDCSPQQTQLDDTVTNENALFDSLADELEDLDIDTQSITAALPELQVDILPESPLTLKSCPRILTPRHIHQLLHQALPTNLKMARWDRIYAVGRDGDTFYAMLQKCNGHADTVVVAQTSLGHIVGGYASAPWKSHGGGKSYFGTGKSFLFCTHPQQEQQEEDDDDDSKQDDDDNEKPLSIFKWTGRNVYSQSINVSTKTLAMGGGDDEFGLLLHDGFSRGSTGFCSTFGNPPLVKGGHFQVVNFEVWGFTTLGATTRTTPNTSFFNRGLFR